MVSAWKVGAEAPVDDWKRFLSPNCGIVTTLELAKAKPTGLPSPRPKTDHCPSSWPGQSRPAGGSLQSFWSGHVLAHLKGTQRQSSLQLTRQTVMKAGLQDRHPWRRSSLASGHGEEWAWYNGGPLVHWALGHIFSSRMIRRDLSFVPKTCSVHTQARAHTHTQTVIIYMYAHVTSYALRTSWHVSPCEVPMNYIEHHITKLLSVEKARPAVDVLNSRHALKHPLHDLSREQRGIRAAQGENNEKEDCWNGHDASVHSAHLRIYRFTCCTCISLSARCISVPAPRQRQLGQCGPASRRLRAMDRCWTLKSPCAVWGHLVAQMWIAS